MIRRASVSTSSLVAGATPSTPDSWPAAGSTDTGPMAGDIPHRQAA
jgi:hypothetical protein